MSHKIVLAGGTGFIGKYLKKKFSDAGYKVFIISRKNNINWESENEIIDALNNASMVINLAGKSVDCRYNEKNKKEIFSSRTETTAIIGNALLQCDNPPPLWINSSTATIYRHADDRPMTETDGEIGTGFSVDVATTWEKSFFDFQLPQTRQIALRMAIVLGKDGGAMLPIKNLVRSGLGGIQGNGNQMFSWIHIEDLYNIILFLEADKNLKGVFNCSSPNPVDNYTFMKCFREVLHIPIGLPSPKFLLELGAFFIRTETELILKSRWVVPDNLMKAGYKFKYSKLTDAFNNLLKDD